MLKEKSTSMSSKLLMVTSMVIIIEWQCEVLRINQLKPTLNKQLEPDILKIFQWYRKFGWLGNNIIIPNKVNLILSIFLILHQYLKMYLNESETCHKYISSY